MSDDFELHKKGTQEKIEKIMTALYYYADIKSWNNHTSICDYNRIGSSDCSEVNNHHYGGKLAREVLKEVTSRNLKD